MAKCESVTIRIARGGYIVDAYYPYQLDGPGILPAPPRQNIPTVAGSLRDALEKVANLLGGSISVSENPPSALTEEPSELFGTEGGGGGANLY